MLLFTPGGGGFGWEAWFPSIWPFCLHVVAYHSVVCLSIFTWRLSSETQAAEAAQPPKAWPTPGLHHILPVRENHRAAGHLEERE